MSTAFDQLIAQNAAPKTPAAKRSSSMPVLVFEDLGDSVEKFRDAHRRQAEAAAEMAAYGDSIINRVRREQDERAYEGDYRKSFEVKGSADGESVKFITADRFSAIAPTDVPALERLLGDKFERCIVSEASVTLKKEVFDNAALQQRLVDLLGDDWSTFFDTTVTHKVVSGFDAEIYKAVPADRLREARTMLKQSKPSLR